MANYLPVLLGSVSAIPDDTAVSDLPRGQVDYLSHDWREEDVWRSWRSMTRLKNEIANGMRLENASWRTWWKQRNKLKTVSPETLNWLKDSDVTWLYGPLHTADYPTPTPKPSPNTAAALDLPMISSPPPTTKPILKHRSIMEVLTYDLPSSPIFSPPESDEDEVFHVHSDCEAPRPRQLTGPGVAGLMKRPLLIHTKSDTHISRWGPNRAFRRDSPPRIIASDSPVTTEMVATSPHGSSSDPVIVPGQKRKHISFNTFVEQCIAIEKPKKKRSMWNTQFPNSNTPHNTSPHSSSTSEDEDQDQVLEMRVRHTTLPHRSSSHSSSSTSSSSSRSSPLIPPSISYSHRSNPSSFHRNRSSANALFRTHSADKELVTIALIAPTILKTRAEEDDHYPYPHPHSYPHPSTGDNWYAYGSQDSPVELVCVPPSYICSDDPHTDTDGVCDLIQPDPCHTTLQPGKIFGNPLVASPTSQPDVLIKDDDICAYFDHHVHTQPESDDLPSVLCYTQAGIASSPLARNLEGPEVVVSSEDTPVESRLQSKSRSRSRSRTPSPALTSVQIPPPSATVHVPRTTSSHPPYSSRLLQPHDAGMSRGRSASSPTLPSHIEQQTRGRSITRTSSFSDRDSESIESPIGSLSPDSGFGFGIRIGSACAGGRDRDSITSYVQPT